MEQITDVMNVLIYGIRYDNFKIVYANHAMRAQYPDLNVGECCCYEILHGYDAPCDNCPLMRLQATKESVSISSKLRRGSRWLEVVFDDCEYGDGTHICLCTGIDVTGLKETARIAEDMLNGVRVATYIVDAETYEMYSMNQFLKGLIPDAQDRDPCYRVLWDRDEPCRQCPIPHLTEENPFRSMNVYNTKLNRYMSIDSILSNSVEGRPVVIFTGYDITYQVEAEKRLKNIAFRDTLVGIKNRAAFMRDLSYSFETGRMARVCITKLKNFKDYNLVYGRAEGDKLLKNLANFYSDAYINDKIYRVGGSKFALIANTPEECRLLDYVIRRDDIKSVSEERGHFHLLIDSVLIDTPKFAESPEALVHNAEYMLQKYKNTDTSEIMYFERGQQDELRRRSMITDVLREKLQADEFEVYYQPIYSIENNDFHKCEALLRLHDEKMGWISPVEFIPIAEECGLINELGIFVLEDACRLIEERKRKGLPPIQVNVNVSTAQFSRKSFFDDVVGTAGKYDIDCSLIQLEVTESIIINSFEYIIEIMKRLIDKGFSFAVDDFGTGYSSLSYIGTLPVEGIKLDKSFVDRIVESEVYTLIVKNVVEIAKGLDFNIVAEGVETKEQYEILRELGCDYIQGYLFSRPLPPDAFQIFCSENEIRDKE